MNSAFKFALLYVASYVLSALSLAASPQFEVARLQPSVLQSGDTFGGAVAIDGDTAVVGANTAYFGGSPNSGQAFIFRRVGGSWSQEAIIGPSDPIIGGNFGSAVAVSGNRVFVSAPSANGPASQASVGAIYVFKRTGTFPFATWSQTGKIYASDPQFSQRFGNSISASGNSLLVGCGGQGATGWAAYYFEISSSGLPTSSERIPIDPNFGRACALDGDLAAFSRYGGPGEVRTFSRSSGTWQLDSVMGLPASENDDSFGESLDLSGGLLVVGHPRFRPAVFPFSSGRPGRLLLSRFSGTTWTTLQPVEWWTQSPIFYEGQAGSSVSTNGQEFVSYAYFYPGGSNQSAAVVLGRWRPSDPAPTIVGAIKPLVPSNALDYLGGPLDLNGETVIIGRRDLDARVVALVPPPPASYCTGKVNSAGCVGTISAVGSASATANSPFEVRATSVLNNKNGLLFFGTNGRTAFPFQGGFLCVLPPTRRTTSQFSGGSSGASNCSGSYVYNFNTLIQSGAHPDLVPGVMVNAQYWYRDPASTSTTGLTNALEFGIGF